MQTSENPNDGIPSFLGRCPSLILYNGGVAGVVAEYDNIVCLINLIELKYHVHFIRRRMPQVHNDLDADICAPNIYVHCLLTLDRRHQSLIKLWALNVFYILLNMTFVFVIPKKEHALLKI